MAVGGAEIRGGLIQRLLGGLNLRFPTLFAIFLALLLADFVLPDPLPFVDELGLALLTLMFGLWKNRRADGAGDEAARGPDAAKRVGRGSTHR